MPRPTLQEYFNTTGNRTYEHIFVNTVPVATAETVGSGDPALSFNYQDHLQSTTLTTNNSGVITESLNYLPFGELQYDEGAHTEQRKYTGHEYDASEYTYAGARYLGTSLGRFISQDPSFLLLGDQGFEGRYNRSLESILSNPQELNSYSYVANNPVNLVDPNGENLVALLRIGLTFFAGYKIFSAGFKHDRIVNPESKYYSPIEAERLDASKRFLRTSVETGIGTYLRPLEDVAVEIVTSLTDRISQGNVNVNQQSQSQTSSYGISLGSQIQSQFTQSQSLAIYNFAQLFGFPSLTPEQIYTIQQLQAAFSIQN